MSQLLCLVNAEVLVTKGYQNAVDIYLFGVTGTSVRVVNHKAD
jgi:hypothetical protein